jgi:hypothetical protein
MIYFIQMQNKIFIYNQFEELGEYPKLTIKIIYKFIADYLYQDCGNLSNYLTLSTKLFKFTVYIFLINIM